MIDYKKARQLINGSGMNVKKYSKGTKVTDSMTFKGMSSSAQEELVDMFADGMKEDYKNLLSKAGQNMDSVHNVTERCNDNMGKVISSFVSEGGITKDKIHNLIGKKEEVGIRDSILNPRTNAGTPYSVLSSNLALPNVWISPYEAFSLYSQKGLFETIINKKADSVMLNGIKIKNKHFTVEQLEKVNDRLLMHNVQKIVADAIKTSLCYGGGLLFPVFKRDTPITMTMNLVGLLKSGILKKNCIERFILLDRWNTFIIPPTNPTQKDFYMPDVFTIPFLGTDVHNSRCARIVTAEQSGFIGQTATQGWGISDFCGYLESGLNYKIAVKQVPLMIQQMSILARTVNVDGVLATEGANALDALVEEETIRTREASPDNPVTMDVLGNLTAINRNFAQVPELLRILRQDVASDATIPEPMLWSSEKGNFSSGDDTEGNMNKQWESVKMIHKKVEAQLKQIAKILVIDALGNADEIIRALPYTEIHFDEPIIANALERSQIARNASEAYLNFVSAQTPMDVSSHITSNFVGDSMELSTETIKQLQDIQALRTESSNEKDRLNNELLAIQVEQARQNLIQSKQEGEEQNESTDTTKVDNGKTTKGVPQSNENKRTNWVDRKIHLKSRTLEEKKKDQVYNKLEQKEHEKVRIGSSKRFEKVGKKLTKTL